MPYCILILLLTSNGEFRSKSHLPFSAVAALPESRHSKILTEAAQDVKKKTGCPLDPPSPLCLLSQLQYRPSRCRVKALMSLYETPAASQMVSLFRRLRLRQGLRLPSPSSSSIHEGRLLVIIHCEFQSITAASFLLRYWYACPYWATQGLATLQHLAMAC